MIARLKAAAAWLRTRLWLLAVLAICAASIFAARRERARAQAEARRRDISAAPGLTPEQARDEIRAQAATMKRIDQHATAANQARAEVDEIVEGLEAVGHTTVAATIKRWNRE